MDAVIHYVSRGGPAILPLCVAAFFLYQELARYYVGRAQWADSMMLDAHPQRPGQLRDTLNQVDSRLRLIRVIAHVLPLLGLLGTVIGMVKTFTGLADVGSSMTAVGGTVSAGIAEALLSTQTGLVFAVPALVAIGFIKQDRQRLLSSYRTAMLEEEAA